VFNAVRRAWQATTKTALSLAEGTPGLDEDTARKLRFFTGQFLDAMAPSNFALSNPEVLAATKDSKGRNLVEGVRNFWSDLDLKHGRLKISMSDMGAFKVGRDLEDDIRRCQVLRQHMGDEAFMMIDANQVWDVPQAIEWVRQLAKFRPWFIEEPTSPDDILGHAAIAKGIAPIRVATGEMCHNRVMFKQFLQSGGMQICQLDSCRLGGVNEVLAVLLLAARYNVPVCPHAGGIGLCEYVQHLSMIDFVCVSGELEGRVAEYSDHLHEHLMQPVTMQSGHYMPPQSPGYSVEFRDSALHDFLHRP
jgi:L-fuconate dehydratase